MENRNEETNQGCETQSKKSVLLDAGPDIFIIEPPIEVHGHEIVELDCRQRYADGNFAVQALVVKPQATFLLSVNLLESCVLPEGWFFLKDWSENKDLAEAFLKSGVIELVPDQPPVKTRFCTAKVARISHPQYSE